MGETFDAPDANAFEEEMVVRVLNDIFVSRIQVYVMD